MTAVALQHREQIIDQLASGEMLDNIAQALGIAAPNISKHLAKDPEYQQAREIGMALKLDRARRGVEQIAELGVDKTGWIIGITQEQSNLARVREMVAKRLEWQAEREHPHLWGQRQQVQFTVAPVLNIITTVVPVPQIAPQHAPIESECVDVPDQVIDT